MKKNLCLIILCCLTAACTRSSSTTPPAASEPPQINSVDVVKATPQEATLASGQAGEVVVHLQIRNGYHVNANPPSQPYLKPTEIEIPPAQGISVESITYPDPLVKNFSFSERPLKVYEGETNLKVRLKADKTTATGKHSLSGKLRVQACDDQVCYAPGTLDLTVPVNIQ